MIPEFWPSRLSENVVPCLSQCTISIDGNWDGWCWYPDRPQDRAVVELFVGTRSIRAVRAARLRTDVRDLAMGDGYCGFQLPLPAKESLSGHCIAEVREQRFGRVIGRVVLGPDGSREATESRLKAAAGVLHSSHRTLESLSNALQRRTRPLEELGSMLSELSRLPERAICPTRTAALAAARRRMNAVPHTDFGWSPLPHVSLVVRAARSKVPRNVVEFAQALREVSSAMRPVGTEILLLDDDSDPMARLLPGRLRNLRLIRSPRNSPPGVGLNAAALGARGKWLAFARADGIATAQLLDAIRDAEDGSFYCDTGAADATAKERYHRLQALIAREVFQDMGGFDPTLDEPDAWADLEDKATLLNQRIVRWKSMRDGNQRHYSSAGGPGG